MFNAIAVKRDSLGIKSRANMAGAINYAKSGWDVPPLYVECKESCGGSPPILMADMKGTRFRDLDIDTTWEDPPKPVSLSISPHLLSESASMSTASFPPKPVSPNVEAESQPGFSSIETAPQPTSPSVEAESQPGSPSIKTASQPTSPNMEAKSQSMSPNVEAASQSKSSSAKAAFQSTVPSAEAASRFRSSSAASPSPLLSIALAEPVSELTISSLRETSSPSEELVPSSSSLAISASFATCTSLRRVRLL